MSARSRAHPWFVSELPEFDSSEYFDDELDISLGWLCEVCGLGSYCKCPVYAVSIITDLEEV